MASENETQFQDLTRDVAPDDPQVAWKLLDIVSQLQAMVRANRRRIADLEEVIQN